jgi:hypothetical protein
MPSDRDYDIEYNGSVKQPDGSYMDGDGLVGWYNEEGQYHREDGPAFIFSDGVSFWYLNGTPHSFKEYLRLTPISDENKMILKLQYA